MRIGVLEILVERFPRTWTDRKCGSWFRRHAASITPQAVAAWCRQLGHRVHYATYYGQIDPHRLLPGDLDAVFISAYTLASPIAYALARIYRRRGVVTILGGPHARSFPGDALRFFDHVVLDCDRELVRRILSGDFDRPSLVSSGRPLTDFPPVEERLPEILTATFDRGRRTPLTVVPVLSSIGCPYACDFCVDWKNPFQLLPLDRLQADLEFISRKLPGVFVGFHDPNFGARFDDVMAVMESLPPEQRPFYVIESSLALVKGQRLRRLRETNCRFIAPGVESFADYSNKSGSRKTGRAKLEAVVRHFEEIFEHIPGIQANFVLGLDADQGPEPAALTAEFIRRLPFIHAAVNIPTPFGDTPLFDRYRAEGRILTAMPFAFYGLPFLVSTLKNYEAAEYFDMQVELTALRNSVAYLWSRFRSGMGPWLMLLHTARTFDLRADLSDFRRIARRLREDESLRAFHAGGSGALPEFYQRLYEERLGPYAEMLTRSDRAPTFDRPPVQGPSPARPDDLATMGAGRARELLVPTPSLWADCAPIPQA
jgi:radical SAM superfamily enzyme YgiQ (UPF0313 family)